MTREPGGSRKGYCKPAFLGSPAGLGKAVMSKTWVLMKRCLPSLSLISPDTLQASFLQSGREAGLRSGVS